MDDLDVLRRSRPDPVPSSDTVARHRRALEEAFGNAAAESCMVPERPRRTARMAVLAVTAMAVAGVAASAMPGSGGDTTRVLSSQPQTPRISTSAPDAIVPCGSRFLPGSIPDGPREHDTNELDPASVSVRLFACRIEPNLPASLTRTDGHTRELVTTLRELMERFGGLEGAVIDEFGRAHPISLAPLAGEDPDTVAVGLIWSGRPWDTPPPPPDQPLAPPTSLNFDPPWVEPRRP